MSLVETSRGCPKMCGFCAASHACPSFREFPLERVRAAVDAAWPHRRKVGMIGAAVLDWGPFRELAREMLERGGSVSPASVRADAVDAEIAEILSRSGHRTVALAPECGDARLRSRVGKRLPDAVFFEAAGELVRAGIVSFKLYFLIGLPGTGREEEVGGITGFLREFRERVLGEARAGGRLGTITAVLSPFVPKPFTPLQWAAMAGEEELRAREEAVASFVRTVPNLRWTGERPRDAILQGYLGLSDRLVAEDLRRVKGGGCPGRPRDWGRGWTRPCIGRRTPTNSSPGTWWRGDSRKRRCARATRRTCADRGNYPSVARIITLRVLGPSNSHRKIDCQVPRTSCPASTNTVTLEPIRPALMWAWAFPSAWR